jgi:hypothetical protein
MRSGSITRRAEGLRARFVHRPLVVALVACGAMAPIGAHAATISVTTGGDAASGATCTLRQAVESINTQALVGACANSGGAFGTADVVDLTLQAGTITLAGSAIPMTRGMVVQGPGSGALGVSGDGASRVFELAAFLQTVTINNLTIADGASVGPGGCLVGDKYSAFALNESVVTGCAANNDPNFTDYANGVGGGIAAFAVNLNQSTVSGNTAQTGGGGVFGKYVLATRSRVANNTVSGLTCDLDAQYEGCVLNFIGGGGILSYGSAQLFNSTVSGNTVHPTVFLNATEGGGSAHFGLGGGISHFNKYDEEQDNLAGARVKRGGATLAPEVRRAARAQFKAQFAAEKARIASTLPAFAAKASKAQGGARNKGDGVGDDRTLGMYASTVSGNTVAGNGAHPGKYGAGGVLTFAKYGGNADIANSTIAGNTLGALGDENFASAIMADAVDLTNSTVAGNVGSPVGIAMNLGTMVGAASASKAKSSPATAALAAKLRAKAQAAGIGPRAKASGRVMKALGPPTFYSSIVAGHGPYDIDCTNPCTIVGSNNLVQSVDGSVTLPPDTITDQDPRLAPLANNGGPAAGATGHGLTAPPLTRILYLGSPAIDQGNNVESFEFDERGPGFPRTTGAATDIGAVEGAIAPPNQAVPALGPWLLALLSATLGVFGLRSQRRRRAA